MVSLPQLHLPVTLAQHLRCAGRENLPSAFSHSISDLASVSIKERKKGRGEGGESGKEVACLRCV